MNAKMVKSVVNVIGPPALQGLKLGITLIVGTTAFLVVAKSAGSVGKYSTQAYHSLKNSVMKTSSNRPTKPTKVKKAATKTAAKTVSKS